VKSVFTSVSCHRLTATEQHSKSIEVLIDDLLNQVAIP
jgi:hypothetical protein